MKIIAANWKLNMGPNEAREFFKKFKELVADFDFESNRVIFFPSAVAWEASSVSLVDTKLEFGSQNCHSELIGAFTGENSLKMLRDLKGKWNLIGHSERRAIFNESDEVINAKLLATQNQGLSAMLCVGESLDQRKSGKTEAILTKQLELGLKKAQSDGLVIAYEPVWAIGTGVVATVEQVRETHLFIANKLSELGFKETPILYGGSVKPDNAADLIKVAHVWGFLVGGASLDPVSFARICRA